MFNFQKAVTFYADKNERFDSMCTVNAIHSKFCNLCHVSVALTMTPCHQNVPYRKRLVNVVKNQSAHSTNSLDSSLEQELSLERAQVCSMLKYLEHLDHLFMTT